MTKDPAKSYTIEHAADVAIREHKVRFGVKEFNELLPTYKNRQVEEVVVRSDVFNNIYAEDNNERESYF